MQERAGGGLITLFLIGLAIWFFFFRIDYSDFWYDGTGNAFVTYCGSIYDQDCSAHPTEYLRVVHHSREKSAFNTGDFHTFEIVFKNGGYVEAEGRCSKAAEGLTFDRVCYVDAEDDYGNTNRYEIHN